MISKIRGACGVNEEKRNKNDRPRFCVAYLVFIMKKKETKMAALFLYMPTG